MRLVVALSLLSLVCARALAEGLPPSVLVMGIFAPHLAIGWQGSGGEGRVLLGLDPDPLAEGKLRLNLDGGSAPPLPLPAASPGGEAPRPLITLTFTYRF